MGHPQIESSAPHLYSQAIQLKLYQSFTFSIPILLSIILFLLFYLFYLKKITYSSSSSSSSPSSLPQPITSTLNQQSLCEMGVKESLKDKLLLVLFDQDLKMKDSQCCVCLGEFEMQEELHQIPSCRHVFHIDCISHWLYSNSTCPLCRGSVIKQIDPAPSLGHDPPQPVHDPRVPSPQPQQEGRRSLRVVSNFGSCPREHHVIMIEGSSSNSTQQLFR